MPRKDTHTGIIRAADDKQHRVFLSSTEKLFTVTAGQFKGSKWLKSDGSRAFSMGRARLLLDTVTEIGEAG